MLVPVILYALGCVCAFGFFQCAFVRPFQSDMTRYAIASAFLYAFFVLGHVFIYQTIEADETIQMQQATMVGLLAGCELIVAMIASLILYVWKRMRTPTAIIALLTFSLFGCYKGPDPNEDWHVICYSGDHVIYEGHTAQTPSRSSYASFYEKPTGKYVIVSEGCVFRIEAIDAPKTLMVPNPSR